MTTLVDELKRDLEDFEDDLDMDEWVRECAHRRGSAPLPLPSTKTESVVRACRQIMLLICGRL